VKAGLSDNQKLRIGRMFTRIAHSWEPRFSEAALRQFGRDKKRFTNALKKHKQAVNWDNVLMGWQQLYEEAGDEWRSTFVPLMKGVIETQAEQQSVAFGMQFDVRNLYAEAWFDNYTMDFASGVMDTTGLTLNQLLQDAQREGWSIPETEKNLGLVFDQWMRGNLSPDSFAWFSQRMPAYRRELIARTEIIRSSNAGINELYRQWGVEYKEWLATEDDRTCPWCLEMNGKVIPIGGTFWEQGSTMTVQVGQLVQSMTFGYEAVRFPPLHPF
jgi:hypothetical protein